MAQLSKYFAEKEFACKCGTFCEGHYGRVPVLLKNEYMDLAESLDHLRKVVGVPITVISGRRCPKHPEYKATSEHSNDNTEGVAADIKVDAKHDGKRVFNGDFLAGAIEGLIHAGLMREGGIGTYTDYPRSCHYDTKVGGARRWRH